MRTIFILLLTSMSVFAHDRISIQGSGLWLSDQDCKLNKVYIQASNTAFKWISKEPSYKQYDYKYCIKTHELGLSVFYQFSSEYYQDNLLAGFPGAHGIIITTKSGEVIKHIPGA